jgi:transcriptional regulator with XRE-family HTH domain
MKLGKYLKNNQISLRKFADLAGVSKDTVARIVQGKMPRLESALRVERATGGKVSIKEMVR